MPGGDKLITIDADILRVSRNPDDSIKSYLVSDGDAEAWIPARYFEDNGDGTVTLPEWIAVDRGLV